MSDLGSIKITDVAVNLGGLQVLHDVNLSASRGDLLALLGPNGAGKTTILRTMLGLVKPAKGSVKVAGASPGKGWRHIGYVPQRHEFVWDFPISVADVVMSGRTRHIGWLRRPKKTTTSRCATRCGSQVWQTWQIARQEDSPAVSVSASSSLEP